MYKEGDIMTEPVFFSMFRIAFFLIFAIVISGFIFTLVKRISTWNKNNHSPRLKVNAIVVSKRTETSSHSSMNGNHRHHHHTTYYYVTFQVDSGDRIEFTLTGQEFGMLVEGDVGKLDFQGSRYHGFIREMEEVNL